uniref:UMOD/GP2/OIT3-like D8C domain-containing protein n=1 Tax=Branchiostoma floridae TaxID=7739 RepID=C3ZVI9_BRAFL|eukprot:XP_002587412.1 hypothetical protein BRAFLDRAFT_100307 [Branchiostoma floridae]
MAVVFQTSSPKAPGDQNPEWYRFMDAAGNQMPTQMPPSENRCGTDFPMWMREQHPSLADGEVSRQGCVYHSSSSPCRWDTTIQVRACSGGYFVYKLPKVPALIITILLS